MDDTKNSELAKESGQADAVKTAPASPVAVSVSVPAVAPAYISFDEFSKVEIKIGKIIAAEKIEGSEKLIKLTIEFGLSSRATTRDPQTVIMDSGSAAGMTEIRTIVSGVAKTYSPEQMVGKQVPVVMNLAPRKLKGVESQGMVLFAIDETPVDGVPSHKTIMLHPEIEVPPASPVQ